MWEAIWATPLPQDKAMLHQALGGCPSHPHFPQGLHLLSGVASLKPASVPLPAQSLAQADLAPVPLPVSETLPRPQTGLFGKGRAFPFCLGFSPCLSVCGGGVGPLVGLKAFSQRHGAGRTHWNTGQAEGWEFSSPAPACLGL